MRVFRLSLGVSYLLGLGVAASSCGERPPAAGPTLAQLQACTPERITDAAGALLPATADLSLLAPLLKRTLDAKEAALAGKLATEWLAAMSATPARRAEFALRVEFRAYDRDEPRAADREVSLGDAGDCDQIRVVRLGEFATLAEFRERLETAGTIFRSSIGEPDADPAVEDEPVELPTTADGPPVRARREDSALSADVAALPAWDGRLARPVPGAVASSFGYRVHPVLKVRKFHAGIDLRAPRGATQTAPAPGLVVGAGEMGACGLGVKIAISPIEQTVNCHLSEIRVLPGETVAAGAVIGTVGATGRATGPHVHLGLKRLNANGVFAYLDPARHLEN